MYSATPRTHIICFGNLWQGDDGFGVHVYRALTQAPLPEHVQVFDAGIGGLAAVTYFQDCQKAIIVDALARVSQPGRVHRLGAGEALPPDAAYSTHKMGLNYLLRILPIALAGEPLPELVIYGAEIDELQKFTDQLSPPLERAVARVERLICREVCCADPVEELVYA